MRILQINSVPYGSTGNIMFALADCAEQAGHTTFCTTGFSWHKSTHKNHFITSGIFEKELHTILAKITGYNGHFSHHATKKLICFIDKYKPDVIHLHNLHGWYLNLPMLFDYIKDNQIPVVWTLHDCWAFTGQCAHFAYVECKKWHTGCGCCPQLNRYPDSLVDRTGFLFKEKKELFTGIENMAIVVPSKWLACIVGQSFLNEYPTYVIPNGINLNVFNIQNAKTITSNKKKIVLGVSLGWDNRKGLDTFIELAKQLNDSYQIVLVGTDSNTDRQLPPEILSIHRTQNQQELAKIYSAADVFVNPTREDTFPTVNLEALASGTPVVTFNVGGSPESIDESCGCVIPTGDIKALQREVERICNEKPYTPPACRERAENFNANEQYRKYITLYETLLNKAPDKRA